MLVLGGRQQATTVLKCVNILMLSSEDNVTNILSCCSCCSFQSMPQHITTVYTMAFHLGCFIIISPYKTQTRNRHALTCLLSSQPTTAARVCCDSCAVYIPHATPLSLRTPHPGSLTHTHSHSQTYTKESPPTTQTPAAIPPLPILVPVLGFTHYGMQHNQRPTVSLVWGYTH